MTPDELVEALAEVVRAGLRKCRHEDAPAPLIHEADLTHITHMVTAELATALRDLLASERAKALREAADLLDDDDVQVPALPEPDDPECDFWMSGVVDAIDWLRDRADREVQS